MASPPQAAASTPSSPGRMSSPARLLGAFVSPDKTFADIAAEPHFILALCVQIAGGVLFAFAVLHRIGAYAVARQSIMSNPRASAMSPDQLNASVAAAAKVLSVTFYASPIFSLIFWLILALIFLGIANFLLGYEATYKQALGMTAHAYLTQTLFALLTVLVIFLMPNPQTFQINNPLGTNLGYFLDKAATSPFVYAMATRIDLFTFWTMVLLSIGLSKLGRKGKFANSFWAVFALWLFYALAISGITAAFS